LLSAIKLVTVLFPKAMPGTVRSSR
jgi:hypothetical protein